MEIKLGREMKFVLDQEWVELILEAKKLGLTKEEILGYLRREAAFKRSQKTG